MPCIRTTCTLKCEVWGIDPSLHRKFKDELVFLTDIKFLDQLVSYLSGVEAFFGRHSLA